MKKFVSIVIALVMVLSMTSAFAIKLDCEVLDFAWTCPTDPINCAKATVDVIPYVATNDSCNGLSYVQSDCAAAINGENIHYALQLTVPADIDPDWWAEAHLYLTRTGLTSADLYDHEITLPVLANYPDTDEDGWVFYNVAGGAWVEETEDAAWKISKGLLHGVVDAYADVEVCLTLKSSHNGQGVFEYKGYVIDTTHAGAANGWIDVNNGKAGKPGYEWVEYVLADGKIDTITKSSNEFLAEVNEALNLGCAYDVCINADNVKAIFGWSDKVEDCYDWEDTGVAVVNPDCSVEIPKTGDVSVVAYAVMAIVAAAGTMLKK